MEYVLELAMSTKSVDHILSHTCPVKYMPVDTFLPFVDQSSVSKRMEEFLDKIEMILGYQKWWCGHYHIDRTVGKMRFMFHDIVEFK